MGTSGTITKKYKVLFVDKAGNNNDYNTIVYARDYNEAKMRADDIMRSIPDDSLASTIVISVTNNGSSWSGIYR